jgi:hypothetical protein
MLKGKTIFIYGGGVLAGAAVGATILPSEGEVCLDSRLMCAPITVHLSDLREDGPQPPDQHRRLITVVTSTASTSTGALSFPIMR